MLGHQSEVRGRQSVSQTHALHTINMANNQSKVYTASKLKSFGAFLCRVIRIIHCNTQQTCKVSKMTSKDQKRSEILDICRLLLILHRFVPFLLSLQVGRLPPIPQDIWEMCPYSSLTTAGEHAS